jgi:glycosyltransferase involved in cell wall biosynthesis
MSAASAYHGNDLRVLFVQRPDASTRFGGDAMLARDNFEAVKALGVAADMVETDRPDARGYDLVHIFNVGQPEICKRQMDACDEAGVPFVLSPVWLDLREYFGRAHAYERLLLNAKTDREVEAKLRRYRTQCDTNTYLNRRQLEELERRHADQAALLRRARVLLPNSAIEARDCLVRLGVRDRPMIVVYIAGSLEPERYWQSQRSGLMAIGRVETRKNQTGLLYALRNEDIEIDIIGATYHADIVKLCLKWCPRARIHGRVPRQPMLEMLGRCEVHALVSWCETAGIATLEAAAAGAKIVVADRGAEVEYFGEDAEYADPADPDSIRAAVQRALARPPRHRGDTLDMRIRQRTWREGAEQTVRAYGVALGSNRSTRDVRSRAGDVKSTVF